jgi:hypothetical protein
VVFNVDLNAQEQSLLGAIRSPKQVWEDSDESVAEWDAMAEQVRHARQASTRIADITRSVNSFATKLQRRTEAKS